MSAFFGAIVGVILVAVVTFVLIVLYFLNESRKKDKKEENKYTKYSSPFDYKFDYNKNTSGTGVTIKPDVSEKIDSLDRRYYNLAEEFMSFEDEINDVIDRINKLEIDLMNNYSEKGKNSEPTSSPDENKETDIPVIGEKYSEKFNELVEETANKIVKKRAKADEKETKDEQH